MRKIAGEENPADLFTKHLESAAKLAQLIGLFSCKFMTGRASSGAHQRIFGERADGEPAPSNDSMFPQGKRNGARWSGFWLSLN